MSEKNSLFLEEITQFHSIIKDFSNQSASIKKVSITLYIAFLSVYYGANTVISMKKSVFVFIGVLIPIFCYIYEIYIDFIRQKMRIRMQDKIIRYQELNSFDEEDLYKPGVLVLRFFCFRIIYDDGTVMIFGKKRKNAYTENKQKFYVNLFHSMYFIYFMEILSVLLAEVFS